MRVALLTSSRADFGIYLPLIKEMKNDSFFELYILAFGTHLSKNHGKTIDEIKSHGYQVAFEIDTLADSDTLRSISGAMGKTMINFSEVWNENPFDLILALGDRFEMFAACAAAVPFGIPIAHIHGGETTLGAIDDAFRNSITQMATYHFTTTEQYKDRVMALIGSDKHVYKVGALSIDNLRSMPLLSISEFKDRFNIDLSIPTILITFHPETVAFQKNEYYIAQLIAALKEIDGYQFVITMPNADTMGNMIRKQLTGFVSSCEHAKAVESFGALGYLSCMKHCRMLLGNTSSGFVEASFFPRYVINLGERQTGRIISSHINNCEIEKEAIINAVIDFKKRPIPQNSDVYGDGTTAKQICSILKNINLD